MVSQWFIRLTDELLFYKQPWIGLYKHIFSAFWGQCLASSLFRDPFPPLSFFSVTFIWSSSVRNGHDLTWIMKRPLKERKKQQSSDQRNSELQPWDVESLRTSDAVLSYFWLPGSEARIDEATGWWRGWSQGCTEHCLRGQNVHISVAPSQTTKREGLQSRRHLTPSVSLKWFIPMFSWPLHRFLCYDHPLD